MTDGMSNILKDYALKLLAIRPRSENEILKRLKTYSQRKNIPSQEVIKVIDYLTGLNFINDEEFVFWWIRQRREVALRGKRAVLSELLRKGVKKETILKFLNDGEFDSDKEYALAQKLLDNKMSAYKNLSKEKFQRRVSYFLSSKGFERNIIYRVMNKLRYICDIEN